MLKPTYKCSWWIMVCRIQHNANCTLITTINLTNTSLVKKNNPRKINKTDYKDRHNVQQLHNMTYQNHDRLDLSGNLPTCSHMIREGIRPTLAGL